MRIAIAGAGISGLTTAFYLKRARPDWQIVVYEPRRQPGGTMETVNVNSFLFEAGGNGFLTNKPDSLQLAKDSGADGLLMPSSDLARRRFIFSDALHRLPENPPLFLKSKLISFPEKLRVLGEVFVPARRDGGEETLQEFGYRRVGKGFTDVFLDAMVAGIYATTPDRVSVEAAFPLVVELEREYGGLFKGMFKRRRKQAGPGGILMSFKGGVSTFIRHLHDHIDADWRMGDAVTAVHRDGDAYRVDSTSGTESFDQVVIATPAHVAASMLAGLDAELSNRLNRIDYSPVGVVGFGYSTLDHPLEGFGLLTTTASNLPILGVLWDSSIFPDRAPAECKSVRIIIGGQRNPELVDQDERGLIATAREGLEKTMGITGDPDVTFVRRWDKGIPSYAPGHIGRVDAIFEQLEQNPGLHLGGNAYRGIAMNDCVRNGRQLAEKIAG